MCATSARHRAPRRDDACADAGIWVARQLVSSSPGGALSKHARRTPTRFGLHVGRVGALAVSLGVGFAITSTSGVAYAGTESESAASSDSKNDGGASEGESPTSTGTGTGTGTDADADSEQSEQDNDESDGDDASTPDIDDSETDPIDGDDEEGDDSDAGDPSDTDTVVEEEPTDYEGSVGDAPPPASEADRDVPVETPHQPPDSAGETPVDDGPSIDEADESSTMIDDEAGVSTGAGSGTEVVDLGSTVPASVETGTVATDPATGSSVESVDILTTVVSSVLAPFSDPAIPARAPWFDALLAWVRRQIRHTFFNESPEWGPATSQQLLTGQVLLDLKARDPDGDPLTFTIVQPKYGLVVRDPITGNFIYTPTTVVTGAPLVDNFKVTISDSSEHLTGLCGVIQGVFHFLARAIGLAEPDEVTLMVPVTVNPIVEMAPILVVTPVAAGTAGDEIRVSPVVVITDLDSNTLTSATVTLDDAESGQSLDYGELPSGVTASYAEGVLTFSGAATVQAYQQLLASVTLTTTTAALTTVSFRVVDDQENESLPAVTVVTVVGLPVELPPLVIVSPVAAGAAGSPITISPIVVITDLDSQEIHSATVTLDDPSPGDVLAWGTVPSGIEVTTGHGSVTFTGSATVDEYEQLLQSVTLTSTTAALKSVSFTVVDSDGNQNTVPANTIVTVIGLPVEIPPLLIVSPVATGLAGTAIRITPIAVITDLDSEQIRSATVTVENAVIGDVLGYGAVPDGVVVSSGGGSVTFTGIASIDDFEQLLESITLTSAGPGIKTVSFTVTDVDGNTSVVPAFTVVTVVGLGPVEVSPILVVAPAAAGLAGQPVTVSPIVVLTDPDSDIESVVVTVDGDGVLGWGALPGGIDADDSVAGQVTFTGAASAAVYQQVLQSITLTSSVPGLKSVSFAVTDADGNTNVVPAGTVVTVVGLGPVEVSPILVVAPAAAGLAGQPVTVSPIVVLTDPDSDIESVVVTVDGGGVLGWTLSGGIDADDSVAGQVTFTGAASAAVYQQVLQSLTVTSSAPGLQTVSFEVTDVDGNANVLPAFTVVTVVGLGPVEVSPILVVAPAAAGLAGQPVTVSPIVVLTDPDSDIDSVVVTVDGDGVLGWGSLPGGIDADDSVAGQVTFTGAASAAVYQQVLQSLTLTSSVPGLKSVSFAVTDVDGNANVLPAFTVVTVVGLGPVEVSPILVVAPAAAGLAGQPVTVSPIVVLTDPDSDIESVVVTVDGDGVFGWGALPGGIDADDSVAGQVTFTGAASAAVYQQVLQSITLTSASAGISTVSFTVIDVDGNTNVVPAFTVVTVVGLGPVEVSPILVVAPAAAGLAGQPVTVSPIVVLTDPDSDIESVVVTVDGDGVLGWGSLPGGIDADDSVAGQVTFTGAASAAVYQQVLQSITLTSASAGISTVSFTVTDADGNTNVVPAFTVVTVVGLGPVEVSPILVVAPAAAGLAGQPITVSPIVVLTDPDSDIESVVVTVDGDGVLGWTLSGGIDADDSVAGQVTFTGAASAAVYQQVLQSLTLTSASTGVSTVSFTATDEDGNTNVVPAGTVVTVVGLGPVEVSPILVVAPAAAGLAGQPVTVSPIVVLTDPDSDIESVVVTVTGDGVLGWTLSGGIDADDSVAGQVTFSGAATAAAYQDLLQSLTLTSASTGVSTVSFTATDEDGNTNAVPAFTVVTVVGLGPVEVSPILVVAPAAAGLAGQPVTVSPIVVLTDPDSDIESVVVTVDGDGVLGWGALPGGIDADDSVAGRVTFTGAASAAVYQQVLQSITVTSSAPGLQTVSFEVTDVDGNANAVPAFTVVTVVGLGPVEVSPILVVAPAAAGLAGQPVTVSPIVVLTDPDSDIESVVVTVDGDGVLGWGSLPGGIDADDSVAGQVTFTGAASAAVYQQVLQSITLTSASAGISTVSFTVTDADGNTNVVPAFTVVTVVGLGPVEVSPILVVAPAAAGLAGQPITVSPIVVLTDPDSDIESVVVTVDGDGVLGWTLSGGIDADDSVAGQVTFTGAASAAVYQQVLQSLTLTSASTGVSTVSFTATDEDGNTNAVPAGTVVTVVGLGPVEVSPILVVAPAAAGLAGQPITVSPIVVLTDPDSDIESVVVTVDGGGVLGWTLSGGIDADDSVAGQVTFTGAASAAVYQQVLQSLTLTSSTPGLQTVSFEVTDVDGNSNVLPAATAVTVVGLGAVEVAPVVIVAPAAAGTTGQPITVSPVVVLTDPDSDIESVVVTVDGGGVLGWTLSGGIDADDSVAGQVTFSGAASAAVYQQVLQSLTLTSSAPGLQTVSFEVTDVDGNTNVLPAATAVTVVGLGAVEVAPVVIVAPAAAGTTGQPITVSPVVVLTDPDSDIESVVVTVDGDGVFGWGALLGGIDADDSVAGQVTFSGAASAGVYQQVLQSVTLTSATAGVQTVSFEVTDVDGNSNVLPAATAVTVVGLGAVEVAPVVIVAPAAAGTTGQPITVSPVVVLTDPDSNIESVVVTVDGDGVFGWGALPGGLDADDSVAGQVTFSGAASAAVYQQVLQSLTLTSAAPGLQTVSFEVTDVDGNTNAVPAGTVVTVVGLGPVEVSPILVVAPAAAGLAGQPITVSPIVVLTDPDSDIESVVVTVDGGGVLGWTLSGGIDADDSVAGQVTFTGAASAAVYQQVLQSLTLTSASTGVSTVSFTVTDVDGNSNVLPAATAVTVVGLGAVEVAPVVIVAPAAAGTTGQPITVSPIVVLTDPDSDIESVVVTVDGGGVLGWTLSGGIDADDSVAGQVTFSGAASAAVYQQVLQSVTLTSATAGVQTVSFEVTDVDGNTNVLPAATAVTVVGLGPVEVSPILVVAPAAAGLAGQPITVSPVVVLTDPDSDIDSVVVTVDGDGVLGWGTLPGGIDADDSVAGQVTFFGAATEAAYRDLLQSLTLTSSVPGLKSVSFAVTDVDGNTNVLPAATAVTVVGLGAVEVAPVVIVAPAAAGTTGQPVTVSPIVVLTDPDSDIESVVVTVDGGGVLGWTLSGGIDADDSVAGQVTFSGAATAAAYQDLLQSLTLTSGTAGISTVSFAVTDADGNTNVLPAATAVTVVGLGAVEVAPVVIVAPAAAGTTGQPITVSPIVVLTDPDSDIESVVVTVDGGGVLGWTLSGGIDADDSVAGQVTFSGAASAAVYQQVLQSLTLTSSTPGLQTVSFEVTDVDGNTNVLPAATAVTVVGLGAVEVAPVVIVAPAAAGTTGQPITVSPVVVLTDPDSDIESVVVTVDGDGVFGWGALLGGIDADDSVAGQVTFSGAASAGVYQQVLQSVTLTSATAGVQTVSFEVTDVDGNTNVLPAATAVTVVGLGAVKVAPVVIVAPAAAGTTGQPITVSPVVVLTDPDSDIESVVVTVTGDGVLGWGTLSGGITADDSVAGQVTFTGAASESVYQQVLQSITLTSATAGLSTVEFTVTDVDGNTNVLPAATAVTVVGLGAVEVAPVVIVAPAAAGTTGQPVTVSPIVVLTDPDSDIESVVVTVDGGGVLGWTLSGGIDADDSVAGQVTFTGAASAAVYQQVLQSLTLTSSTPGLQTVSFEVTDVDGNSNVLPAATAVTVVGLGAVEVAPVVIVAPAAAGTTGQPITVSPVVVLTDPDSDIESVVVTVDGGGVLGWTLSGGIDADDSVAGQVTFSGAASAAVYQQVLQSLTLTSSAPGLQTVSFEVTDVDGNTNVLPAATAVTVVGLGAVEVAPVVIVAPAAAGTTGQPITVSPVVVLTDPDSDIESVVVTVDGDGVFGWGALLGGIDADDSVAGQVTFSGAASAGVYQQVLQSLTLTSASTGVSTVSFEVTDVDGNTNVLPAATAVTVVGLGPVEVSPILVVAPAAAGLAGQPITVSPVVVLTDPDSDIESVVVTVDGDGVFGWGTLPGGIDADDSVAGQVTFSGAASAAVYQQVLQSVTLTSATAGVQTVSFEVTDVDGNTNVLPAATAVTVVGLGAVEVAPVLIVAPAAAGTTGQPITVSPIVVLTDPDSDIESVVVTVDGDGVFGWGALLGGIDADDSVAGQVTFSGAASAAVYQQVLQSLTLTSASTGVSTVSFTVTDVDGNSNVLPAATAVTVVGLGAVEVAPVVIVAPAAAGTTGQPITVSPIVVLTDPDSDIESVVVTVDGGGVLGWTLSGGIDADDSVAGQVTFSGAASAAVYQQVLQSVTLTSATAGLSTVEFTVTDVDGNSNVLPAATAVTVVGLGPVEVSPVLIVAPAAAGTTGQPITVSPVVVLTDPDSDIESVVVTVDGGGVLGWTLSGGIDADDSVAGQVTFSGAASAAVYQQVLQSLTLTSSTAGISTVSFEVTDVDGNTNVLPAATAVTVVGLGAVEVSPILVVAPAAAGTTGQPITVSPIVVLTDPDSNIESVVVTVDGDGVFGWGALPGGIDADDSVAGQVTFSGAATAAVYQQVLQSLTLTSASTGVSTVSFEVTDVDGNSNVLPAATAVTVVGLGAVEVAPVVIVAPAAAGTTGQPITVSPVVVLTDPDSDIESVVVTVTGDGVLGWDALPVGISADDQTPGQVTFTGAASAAVYQQVLQSITLTSGTAGISTVSFAVTDAEGNTNVLSAATTVTVVGLGPVEVSPVLIVAPAAAGTTGQPITVSPVVVLTDPDSDIESVVVTVTGDGVLGWGTLSGGITADDQTPGQVTFTGAASASVYQQVLQSITLTSASTGISTVSFTVTDADGNTNVLSAGTVVTVVGLGPVEVSPVLIVAPAAAGTTGQPITVSPVVVLTDPDSDIESVVVTVTGDGVLGWGALSGGISADDQTPGQVTFTGAASAAVYQQVLQSITLTSGTAGISTVSFAVTDADGNTNALSAATTVTVVGLPASAPIVLTSIVSVPYTAGATAVTVDPAIILLDGDSGIMSGATVTVVDPEAGDTLSWGTLPPDVVANFVGGVLTFEGDASVGEYQDLLRSVRFATNSTASTAVRVIEFTVTDDTLATSTAGSVGVTVLSLPILATPVVVTSVANVNYTAGSTATTVDSNLVLLDADSSMLSGAVVSIVGGAGVGETLSFQTLGDIDGNYSNGVLTFEGAGTLAEYQQVLRSVTYSTSSGALATIKSIAFVVTDADGRVSSPGLVAVTIVSAPLNVAPLVVTSSVNLSYTAGGTPLTIDGNLSLLDLDSSTLKGATVKIVGNLAPGDILGFIAQPGISGSYDGATGTLTFTGDAAVSVYQQLLRSVTISTGTSALATIKTVSFTVTDFQNATSLPGSVAVTVVAAPVNLSPLVTTLLGPIYTAGNTAVQVNPLLTVLDLDTANMSGATVAITQNFALGDVLNFTSVAGINGSYNSTTGVLTFTGTATALQYQQLLQSVTFASGASAPTVVKTLTFTVTDALGATSPDALALVTQKANTAPVVTAPLGLIVLSLPLISPTAVIVDDSSYLDRATVTLTNVQSGDSLSFTPTGNITGAYSSGVLTLTGLGTVAEYQAVLRSVSFSKHPLNLVGFRDITVAVRDAQGLNSNTASGTITFLL